MNKWIYFIIFHIKIITLGATTSGQLTIIYSPPSLEFCGCESIPETNVKEMYSAALGLTHNETSEFHGLKILDPFDTPEAIVEISIVGYYDIDLRTGPAIKYKLEMDDSDPDTFYDVTRRIIGYQGYSRPTIAIIALTEDQQSHENSNLFSNLNVKDPSLPSLKHLKYTTMEDYEFLLEIELLRELAKEIKTQLIASNGYLDFYEIYFSSFNDLAKIYGLQSIKVQEAINILNDTILELKTAFVDAYNGSVLIALLSAEEIKYRIDHEKNGALFEQMDLRWRARRQNEESDISESNFSMHFNLIFWFTLGYIYALAISISAIFSIKPDTNSIIYRLSNQRPRAAEH